MGEPTKSFQEYDSKGTVDVYPSIHMYYSEDNKLEAVELFGKNVGMSINAQLVFPGTLGDAKKILPDLVEYFGSYVSKSWSIGISVEGENIVSVLAGCKNYYA